MSNVVNMKKKEIIYEVNEQPLSMVMEKETPYLTDVSYTQLLDDNPQYLINKTRAGLSMRKLKNLTDRYNLTLKEIATILNISERTLQRYDDDEILSKDITDRALHLQRLYERGAEVFGFLDNFCDWMKSEVLIFNNEKPISFLDTIFGFELLEQELGRIEHGIFA